MLHRKGLTGATGPGIVARLRLETRAEHDAIEAALDWEARASSRLRYAEWLSRLHRFHRVWEPVVASAISDPVFFDPRRKLHWLEADLHTLGEKIDAGHLEQPETPVLSTKAAAWGSLYVLEGSTLGGQLIARHVRATLGFNPVYHGGYGAATGEMWRSFKRRFEECISPAEGDEAVAAAAQTFRDLGGWLTTGSGRVKSCEQQT